MGSTPRQRARCWRPSWSTPASTPCRRSPRRRGCGRATRAWSSASATSCPPPPSSSGTSPRQSGPTEPDCLAAVRPSEVPVLVLGVDRLADDVRRTGPREEVVVLCLLYTSDAADDLL